MHDKIDWDVEEITGRILFCLTTNDLADQGLQRLRTGDGPLCQVYLYKPSPPWHPVMLCVI